MQQAAGIKSNRLPWCQSGRPKTILRGDVSIHWLFYVILRCRCRFGRSTMQTMRYQTNEQVKTTSWLKIWLYSYASHPQWSKSRCRLHNVHDWTHFLSEEVPYVWFTTFPNRRRRLWPNSGWLRRFRWSDGRRAKCRHCNNALLLHLRKERNEEETNILNVYVSTLLNSGTWVWELSIE